MDPGAVDDAVDLRAGICYGIQLLRNREIRNHSPVTVMRQCFAGFGQSSLIPAMNQYRGAGGGAADCDRAPDAA